MIKNLLMLAVLGSCAACFAEVPAIEDTAFSCVDDLATESGNLQCPESHWCYQGSCKPRLGCSVPNAERPECEEFVTRCELVVTGTVSAVSCEPGVHTVTSTKPSTIDGCDCPDGTWCVAYDEALSNVEEESFGLFVLPGQQSFPDALGASKERRGLRVCARGCSGELDCTGGHTCRPAAVVTASLLSNPSETRNTIGVCYPDKIVTETATSAELPVLPLEPRPQVCLTQSDCRAREVAFELCQVRVAVIPDHPSVPAGSEAWGEHLALVSTCVTPISAGLTGVDKGCDNGSECESGICHNGRCARLCDATLPEPCPGGRSCRNTQVSRPIRGDAQEVRDRIWLCQGL